MITEEEMILFIKHLYNLVIECKKCEEEIIKKQIIEEINLLCSLI